MRRFVLAGVVLALLVLGAGCLGMDDAPDRSDQADATLDAVNAAIRDVTTYRARTKLQATAVVENEQISRDATIVGAVNATQKRSKTTLEIGGETRTVYTDNQTVYQQCESPWGWANESIDAEGPWIQETTLWRHVELLETGDLRVETPTAFDQNEAVALVGNPTQVAVEEYSEESAQSTFDASNIENVTIRLVVDNQTHRPVRGSITIEVTDDGGSATVTMETTFSDYGDPITVSIPQNVTEDEIDWEGGCPGS